MDQPRPGQARIETERIHKAVLAGVNAFFATLMREEGPSEVVQQPEEKASDRPPFDQLRDREMGDFLATVWDGCTEGGAKLPHKFYANKMLAAGYDEYEGFAGEKRSARLLFKARHDDALQKFVHTMHL